jgi:hypothetical protein
VAPSSSIRPLGAQQWPEALRTSSNRGPDAPADLDQNEPGSGNDTDLPTGPAGARSAGTRSAGETDPGKSSSRKASSREAREVQATSKPRKTKPPGSPSDRPQQRYVPLVPLLLGSDATGAADSLVEEVGLLRAAIRRLAETGDEAAGVKVLAELRLQVEALGRALKTQRALGGDTQAELVQTLVEIDDGIARLGGPERPGAGEHRDGGSH